MYTSHLAVALSNGTYGHSLDDFREWAVARAVNDGYNELCNTGIRGIFPSNKEPCGYTVLQIIPLSASPCDSSLGERERLKSHSCGACVLMQTFERIVWTLLDLDDLHGALAQIRRFVGGSQWTPDANGLLYFLGNWAQEDDDKRRRFLELPFTKKVC